MVAVISEFVQQLTESYTEAVVRMEEILRSRDVVDRPQPGKIYIHRGVEVEVVACHGTFCWVVETHNDYPMGTDYHTPYTLSARSLEEAQLKPGDQVHLHGVMGATPSTVIAVDSGKVWHRSPGGNDRVDLAAALKRVP